MAQGESERNEKRPEVTISYSYEVKPPDWKQLVRFVKDRIRRSPDLIDERRFLWPSGYDAAQKLAADAPGMVERAGVNAAAFDELRAAVAWLADRDESLPKPARDWLVLYLRGQFVAPKPLDGRKLTQHGKELFVQAHVNMLCAETDLKATRNDAGEPISACDVVADALAEAGMTPATYRGVKDIWLRRPENWHRK